MTPDLAGLETRLAGLANLETRLLRQLTGRGTVKGAEQRFGAGAFRALMVGVPHPAVVMGTHGHAHRAFEKVKGYRLYSLYTGRWSALPNL